MILAAVDDLLFSSKIRNVARRIGVEVVFARSRDAIVEQARSARPALTIVDLNGDRMRPLEVIAAIRADPELAALPVIGFVSHVQADLIDAARAAGIDQVMARSAFSATLPDLLAAAK
jgi:CheY-like chemotaxis protein